MRLHVLALPHTRTAPGYHSCAYTQKVINFCRMMTGQGARVILYGTAGNQAPCDEHVVCLNKRAQERATRDLPHYTAASFDPAAAHWQAFNAACIAAIGQRRRPRDILCVIAGTAQEPVARAFPDMIVAEYGIGYAGSFAHRRPLGFRAFESHAWRHACTAAEAGDAGRADGRFMDATIPGYLDIDAFPEPVHGRAGHLLFIGRMIERKGLQVVADVARATGRKLIVAGPGTWPHDIGQHVGEAAPELRNRLMAHARCVLMPTLYLEPFGNVAIEAQACGTPVVATDWGAMTETVEPGMSGFRCRTLQDFVDAVDRCAGLDRPAIRERARRLWSLEAVAPQFTRWFEQLLTVHGDGWYTLRNRATNG